MPMNAALQMYDDLASMNLTVEEALKVTDELLAVKNASGPAGFGIMDAAKYAPGLLTGASSIFKNVAGGAKNLIETSTPLALAAGAIPLAGGYTVGRMLAGAMDVDSSDVAEIQEQELIRELEANAEQVRRRTALRAMPSSV